MQERLAEVVRRRGRGVGRRMEDPVEAGAVEDVAVGRERVVAGREHDEAADQEGDQRRQHRHDDPAAALAQSRRAPRPSAPGSAPSGGGAAPAGVGSVGHADLRSPTPSISSPISSSETSPACSPTISALVDDEDPVGEREDLLELERDRGGSRGPRRARSTSRRWRNSIAPTSRPRVGCAAISTLGSRSISRAATTFCWLPPERPPAGVCGPAAAHVELLDQAARTLDQSAAGRASRAVRPAASRSRGGRGSRRSRTRARARGAAGPPGCGRRPRRASSRARCVPVLAAGDRIVPGGGLAQPGDRVDQLGLAVAVDAGDADDLARADVERDAAHLLDPAVVDDVRGPRPRAATSPGLGGGLSTRSRTSRPTIARASDSSVAPSRGTVSIVLPRRSTVIRSAISSTSFSLWVMKMIDFPSAFRLLHDREQLGRLLRGQHGRRLVEDEDRPRRGRAP